MNLRQTTLGILGTGNMASALIYGLLSCKVLKRDQIIGCDKRRERLRKVHQKFGIRMGQTAKEVLIKSRAVLLAVKPQDMGELLLEIAPSVTTQHLIFSIAAGIDMKFLSDHLGKRRRIVRLMPNMPALIGMGGTAFFLNPRCSVKDRKLTEVLFSSVGIVCEVKKEALLNTVTGLSGSGPAYVYAFIDSLIRSGIRGGLREAVARELTLQTVIGSAFLLKGSKLKASQLINQVASKGGTTQAGLEVLRRRRFSDAVQQCVRASIRRAKKLSRSS